MLHARIVAPILPQTGDAVAAGVDIEYCPQSPVGNAVAVQVGGREREIDAFTIREMTKFTFPLVLFLRLKFYF